MRTLPDGMLDALRGSAGDVSVQFNVWYNQQLVYQNIPESQWSLSWDATRDVKGQLSLAVLDPDGVLLPWGYDDPLSVGGGHIQTKFICGDSSLDWGYQRITRSDPEEKWKLYEPDGVKLWVVGTHTITTEADDKTTEVGANRFLAPETPAATATVFNEIRRVAAPFMDVIIDPLLTDRPVPSTVVYQDDRLATIQQLADAINADMNVSGAGQLQVFAYQTASVLTLEGGSHDANLVKAKRSATYSGLYNGVVSRNTLPNGQELQSIATLKSGPLAWDGPMGHVPYFHQATFATTQSAIDADAQTMLNTLVRKRASTVPFTMKLHPGLETGDVITLMMPLADGSEEPMPGTLTAITYSGTGGVDAYMECSLDVQDTVIQNISQANRSRGWIR